MTHEPAAQVGASVPPRSFVRGTPSAVEPIPPHLDVAFAEELWKQTVDLWHPELEDCAVPWPEDWPERWDDSEVEDEAALVDGRNGREEVYNLVMGWVRGCFMGCDSEDERQAMRLAVAERVTELTATLAGEGGLGTVDWVREPPPKID